VATATLYRVLAVMVILMAALLTGFLIGVVAAVGCVRSLQPRRVVGGPARQHALRRQDDRRLVVGTLLGGLLLGVVDDRLLVPLLGLLLVVSAYEVWRHRRGERWSQVVVR